MANTHKLSNKCVYLIRYLCLLTMSDKNEKDFNVEKLLKDLFKPPVFNNKENLNELFSRRIAELKITRTDALDIIKIERLALNGILQGTQKRVDFTNLIKIANFLKISKEQLIELYLNALEVNFPTHPAIPTEKIEFIKENFDLAALKKAGFIGSLTDFEEIEAKITSYFGLKDIRDYKRPPVDVAFSAGLVKPQNELTRSFWIKSANDFFLEINNPYEYNRQALIEYFPQIRWHSTSVELGLLNIIKDLFKIGITVIYQPPLPSLHLRGATFSVNEKPCVVLTNYVGFYPTLWYGLIHELYHVLFDWDEISTNCYHLSDDDNERLSVIEKEQEADNFAREYLFSKDKTAQVRPYIKNQNFINEFARNNHVHPSFIYVFNAYDVGKRDKTAWPIAKKLNPNIDILIDTLDNNWRDAQPITDFVKSIKYKLYN
jgi:HTH-type transcriptional regulator/antitoxin HigA